MKPSRRIFLKVSGAAAIAPASVEVSSQAARPAAGADARAMPASGAASGAGHDTYLFFNAPEVAFIEAAVQRLIPPDESGPSALEAGVPFFIDRQLHGAWGAGERLYRAGPWSPGSPTQGYQLPYTPAELYRTALRGVTADLQRQGLGAFETLTGEQQDQYLTQMQEGRRDLGGVPSKVFFESLLAMTVEGYFCDPVYGGNRDMAAWRMIGFPGAYGSYYDLVDQYGVRFDEPPRSLAESGRGQVHLMPNIPATAPAKVAPAASGPSRGSR